MPNRRRRRLSTALSTVAAMAVASPIAIFAVYELSEASEGAPQHREFVQAASILDLPGELISALSQGLSQFGINLPPMPTGMLGGTGSTTPSTLMPGLGSTGLGMPGLAGAPSLTDPGLANPALTNPALTSPTGALPSLTDPALATPGLTVPGVSTPELTTPSLTVPGLTTPPALGTAPLSTAGMPLTGEIPISAPIGLDPALGGYPILGDPSLAAPVATSSGGLIGDLTIPLMLITLGVSLSQLKVRHLGSGAGFAVLRLASGFAVG
ncbi:MAG: hypothetical protein ACPGIJ_10415, partial [Mycobacterium sp.]